MNKQFNDLKKADLIEKCNYSNGNQTIVLAFYFNKKDFSTVRSVF